MADNRPDRNKAVASFVAHLPGLSRLPLVSDDEMARLFGPEVTSALAELDRHNQVAGHCLTCADRCCRLVGCELYAPELHRCPIQAFRPALCRMHFCHRFAGVYRPLVKELGDIFLNSLLAASPLDTERVKLFDCPPFDPYAPGLVAAVGAWVRAVTEGRLSETAALALAHSEAERYRTPGHDDTRPGVPRSRVVKKRYKSERRGVRATPPEQTA